MTDKDISIAEVEHSCLKIGKGTSFDGINPEIIKFLPPSIIKVINLLFRNVFDGFYPDSWNNQMLIPITKKGHTSKNPKMRGIGIGPILSRIYDIILSNRFCSWYIPNPEQAGFRKGQGCILQIFSLILIIDLSKNLLKDLFLALFDYEKAFDFINRPMLIDNLMKRRIGTKYLKAIANMYSTTSYIPKLSEHQLGEEIKTNHGVIQGRTSSANLFSFYVSDLSEELRKLNLNEFMKSLDLVQLADDTAIVAESIESIVNENYGYSFVLKKKILNNKLFEDQIFTFFR